MKIREYPETVLHNNRFKRKKGSCREKVVDQKCTQVRLELASVAKDPKMFSRGSKWQKGRRAERLCGEAGRGRVIN